MNNISVFAEEMNLNHIEDNDLAEEIEMFQRYYDNPESYVFSGSGGK